MAHVELNEWLDQLQVLSQELDFARSSTNAARMMHQEKARCATTPTTSLSDGASLRPKMKPALPPKPQIDSYRYSMTNIQESADVDLDVLLGELCALESQLNDGTTSKNFKMSTKITLSTSSSTLKPSKSGHLGFFNVDSKMMDLTCRPHSPDNDSAFCDNLSTVSGESTVSNGHRSRDSNASSADSTRGSMTTPSPTQLTDTVQAQIKTVQDRIQAENLTDEETNAHLKAEKIKIALEKMKEASVRKIYVKIFSPNGSNKSILVDERWTVSYILRQLAEKNHVPLNPHHAIVEYYADLCMERIYEDHEHLVENILLWSRDSSNKLYFIERKDKNDVFFNPQLYLSPEDPKNMDSTSKRQLLDEFFGLSYVQPPEIEGLLYLKVEGKKAWKKHYFVLRSSGLYYVPKGKSKSSKDLVCLMQLEMVQIYNGIGWKKKYKAPSDFGFALKHPQIQVKASRYIKYLCVDDENSFLRWMVGLRLAKNGKQLYDNFDLVQNYLESDEAKISSSKLLKNSSMSTSSSDSTATTYCKQSIVMRPRPENIKTQTSMIVAESKEHRPRSADIVRSLSVCSTKRGSRQLTHVDVPSVPLMIDSPTVSRRTAAASMDSNHVSDGCSSSNGPVCNGFDSEFRTSTIKKQPNFFSKAHLPLTESTRQIHSVSMRYFNEGHHSSSMDSSSVGSTTSKTTASTEDENDSDEELPAMMTNSDMNGCDSFPPPPSPLPADLCADFDSDRDRNEHFNDSLMKPKDTLIKPNETLMKQNDILMKPNTNDIPLQSARMTLSSTSLYAKSVEDSHRKSSLSIGASTSMSVAPSSSATFGDDHTKFKRPPPPLPPKRSDSTRLTTCVTTNGPMVIGEARKSNDFTNKPNNFDNVVSMDSTSKSIVSKTKSQPPPLSTTNDFHNELQRATFRRLQQLQQSTDAESASSIKLKTSPPPLPPKKV